MAGSSVVLVIVVFITVLSSAYSELLGGHLFSLLPIFPTFSKNVGNTKCTNDSLVFRQQLAEFKLWAVKMLDASTKLPSGVLAGNTFQLGHFDECLSVAVQLPNEGKDPPADPKNYLRGQYCLAQIEYSPRNLSIELTDQNPDWDLFNVSAWHHIKSFNLDRTKDRRDVLYWAVCIPESCTADDLETAMRETLEGSQEEANVDISVRVPEKLCQIAKSSFDFSWIGPGQLVFGAIVGAFVLLVILSTFLDMIQRSDPLKKGTGSKFLDCFSAKRNFRSLRYVDSSKDILVIHTLRFCSMVVILMGHRFIANSSSPTHNAGFMEAAVSDPKFIHLLMGPVLVVDTFFLLSGFLTANQILKDFDTGRFKLISSIIHRYIRLTPVYMLVVAFYALILLNVGSGPLWEARVSIERDRCAANWWTNLLYLNNYINTKQLCMFQSWHLTCDFHFFLIAPAIVYILWKKPKLGTALIVILIAIAAGTLFALTFMNNLDPVLMSFNSVMSDLSADPTFRVTYIPTHTRYMPYLFGILAAYIYYTKKMQTRIPAPRAYLTAVLCGIFYNLPIFTAIIFYSPGYDYNPLFAAIYAALHRIPWCTGLCVMILFVATKNGHIFQGVLTWKALVPLSRLTYCVFLSHGAVQLYTAATLRTPEYYSQFKIFWTLMGDILLTYLLALVMHIFFEAPILRIDRTYFTRSNSRREDRQSAGEINRGFSVSEALPTISQNNAIFSLTGPHEKYRDRYDKYNRRESNPLR